MQAISQGGRGPRKHATRRPGLPQAVGARPRNAQNTAMKVGTESKVMFSGQVRQVRPNSRSARASTAAPAG